MVVKLKKSVSRRIGNLVVTVTADGLVLRKYRCCQAVQVTWEDLSVRLFAPQTGTAAFAQRAPPAWVPVIGDPVYCRVPGRTRAARGRVVGCIPCVPEAVFRILLAWNKEVLIELNNLRPRREKT